MCHTSRWSLNYKYPTESSLGAAGTTRQEAGRGGRQECGRQTAKKPAKLHLGPSQVAGQDSPAAVWPSVLHLLSDSGESLCATEKEVGLGLEIKCLLCHLSLYEAH